MHIAILLVALIIFVTSLGSAAFGFGGGIVAIPLLTLVIGVRDAVTLEMIFGAFSWLMLVNSYKYINWKIALAMTPGLLIGTVMGTLLVPRVSVTFLELFLASSILVFLAKILFFDRLNLGFVAGSKLQSSSVGLAGGLIQGLIGTSGPLLAMYLSVATPRKNEFRATLIYLLFVVSLIRVCTSISQGLVTTHLLKTALIISPLVLIAMIGGYYLQYKMSDRYYRIGVCTLLLVSAIGLILQSAGSSLSL